MNAMALKRSDVNLGPPQPEAELGLLLCQISPVRHRSIERIRTLALLVDFDELERVLVRNGVFSICVSRLLAICPDLLPPGLVEAHERISSRLRAQATLLEAVTTELVQQLEDAGIEALPLKGVLLARRIHGDQPVRPSTDIDILVATQDLGPAARLIERRGYKSQGDVAFVDGLPILHHTLSSEAGLPPVELHWRIHWYETSFSEGLLAGSEIDHDGIRRAGLVDELAALLLFYQRDMFLGMRFAADIAAWWDEYGKELRPGALDRVAARHPELRDALIASAAVVERLVGVPARELVTALPRRPRRSAWAARMADWNRRELDAQAIANLGLIDWLLTPPGGQQAYARRYLLQPPAAFAQQHSLPEEPRLRDHMRRFAHAVVRTLRAQIHLGVALWQVRSGRFWSPLPACLADRPLRIHTSYVRKNEAHTAVLQACDAIPSTLSDSPSNPNSHFPESPLATSDLEPV